MLIIAPGGAFQVFLIAVGHAPDSLLLDVRNSEREAVDCGVSRLSVMRHGGPFAISQDC
jgi:hypothetical protein